MSRRDFGCSFLSWVQLSQGVIFPLDYQHVHWPSYENTSGNCFSFYKTWNAVFNGVLCLITVVTYTLVFLILYKFYHSLPVSQLLRSPH